MIAWIKMQVTVTKAADAKDYDKLIIEDKKWLYF